MTDLPPLFDPKNGGKFTPLDGDTLASLSPERQALYQDVADAAHELEQLDANLKAAQDAVTAQVRAVADAEKATATNQPTFMDNWRAMKATRRADRAQ